MKRAVGTLGRSLAHKGWLVVTGGRPGAMEAGNLAAWVPRSRRRARDTRSPLDGRGGESLAVPTWYYGHEPSNQFATHMVKYFAISVREAGLVTIATRGIVFAPRRSSQLDGRDQETR